MDPDKVFHWSSYYTIAVKRYDRGDRHYEEGAVLPTRSVNLTDESHRSVLAALRAAIDEGDASGVAEGDVFARVRETLNLPKTPR
jgi:hypothetical protein